MKRYGIAVTWVVWLVLGVLLGAGDGYVLIGWVATTWPIPLAVSVVIGRRRYRRRRDAEHAALRARADHQNRAWIEEDQC